MSVLILSMNIALLPDNTDSLKEIILDFERKIICQQIELANLSEIIANDQHEIANYKSIIASKEVVIADKEEIITDREAIIAGN